LTEKNFFCILPSKKNTAMFENFTKAWRKDAQYEDDIRVIKGYADAAQTKVI
jgi:hypothetical protein